MIAALPLSLSACALLDWDDPDWLLSEHRSPDGRLVARLWCENLCDVPGKHTLTISPAARAVAVEPSEVDGFPARGPLPVEDRAIDAYVSTAERGTDVLPPVEARWIASDRFQLSGECLTDGSYRRLRSMRFRDVRVAIVDPAPRATCIQPPADAS